MGSLTKSTGTPSNRSRSRFKAKSGWLCQRVELVDDIFVAASPFKIIACGGPEKVEPLDVLAADLGNSVATLFDQVDHQAP